MSYFIILHEQQVMCNFFSIAICIFLSVADLNDTQELSTAELLRGADILMASLGEYQRESQQEQQQQQQQQESSANANTEDAVHPTTDNNAATDAPVVADREAFVVLSDISTDNTPASTSRPNSSNSSLDDSVVIVGGAAQLDTIKPIGPNNDEDVIFVTEVRQPYRTLATIDLCESFESPKKTTATDSVDDSPPSAKKACNNNTTPQKSTIGATKCPICLDVFTIDKILSTMCGHLFCAPCIQSVIKSRKKCPMCNRNLKQNQVHRIFVDQNS